MSETTHNLPEYSVSELSFALKRTVEQAYDRVRVRGEISGFKRPASGHLYMALKDADAVLDAVCWKGVAGRLGVKPEDGMEVICVGKLTTYPGRSKYQMVIEQMELAGEGALLKLIEDRRKRLAAEGLFAPERKRPIPTLPTVIGVVTSPTGAVIRDILHRVADRFPAMSWSGRYWCRARAPRSRSRPPSRASTGSRPAARSPARPADRRPRRRQPRGPDGLQRGGGGARRRILGDPADLRRRP